MEGKIQDRQTLSPFPTIPSSLLLSISDAVRRLSGSDLSVKLTQGLEDVSTALCQLITRSQREKSSTSVVVVGARGSGKSTAVNRALTRISQKLSDRIVIARLSGLLHAEPGAAYDGIATALKRGGEGIGNALGAITEKVQEMRKNNTTFVVVLDDFEKFVTGGQEVLYNLMNIVHCDELSSIVIGMSSKIDAIDGLEKRVKSRFSQRQLIMKCPTSYDECEGFLKSALLNSDDDPSFQEVIKKVFEGSDLRNAFAMQLLRNNALGRIIRSLTIAFDSMALYGDIKPSTILTAVRVIGGAHSNDNILEESLKHISTLELCLLASVVRLYHKEKDKGKRITFDDVFAEYKSLEFGGNKGWGRVDAEHATFGKGVALKAWERLVEAGLAGWNGGGRKELRVVYLNVEEPEIHGALKDDRIVTVIQRWGNAWLE